MCQQIVQFCSGSTKPLLLVGSLLSLLLALAVGYNGCTTNALYKDIDAGIAQEKWLAYYVQLAAAAYLTLVTVLAIYAAHYDEKHSIRALAVITSVNFVLALAAIAMVPTDTEVRGLFDIKLKNAAAVYDFTDKWPARNETNAKNAAQEVDSSGAQVLNSTGPGARVKRADKEITKEEATRIWDSLQERGCCGLRIANETWTKTLPKSCCSRTNATNDNNQQFCKEVGPQHSRGCLDLIGSTSLYTTAILGLIALANLYLATITGCSAYRTFHYNEASQSAYT